jgi:hypothetical protein
LAINVVTQNSFLWIVSVLVQFFMLEKWDGWSFFVTWNWNGKFHFLRSCILIEFIIYVSIESKEDLRELNGNLIIFFLSFFLSFFFFLWKRQQMRLFFIDTSFAVEKYMSKWSSSFFFSLRKLIFVNMDIIDLSSLWSCICWNFESDIWKKICQVN